MWGGGGGGEGETVTYIYSDELYFIKFITADFIAFLSSDNKLPYSA